MIQGKTFECAQLLQSWEKSSLKSLELLVPQEQLFTAMMQKDSCLDPNPRCRRVGDATARALGARVTAAETTFFDASGIIHCVINASLNFPETSLMPFLGHLLRKVHKAGSLANKSILSSTNDKDHLVFIP